MGRPKLYEKPFAMNPGRNSDVGIKRPQYKRRIKEDNKLNGFNIPMFPSYPMTERANSECTTRQATPEELEWLKSLPMPSRTVHIATMNQRRNKP